MEAGRGAAGTKASSRVFVEFTINSEGCLKHPLNFVFLKHIRPISQCS